VGLLDQYVFSHLWASVSSQLVSALSGAVPLEAEAPLVSEALLVALGLLDQYVFFRPMAEKVEVTEATLLVALGLLDQYVLPFSRPMAVRAELSAAGRGKRRRWAYWTRARTYSPP
jgi:hypothetical protein